LPVTAFTQNAYNSALDGTSQSDNPLKGQRALQEQMAVHLEEAGDKV
jgi:hypothetical protein